MDEADAFLAVRGSDLQRTAFVSIFLRRLESVYHSSSTSHHSCSLHRYFRDVPILTTNHPLEIDLRFKVYRPYLEMFTSDTT